MTAQVELPVLNADLLARLVTWAATDHVVGTNPELAVSLGLAKEDNPRLGRWNQESWAVAERNGVCQTAFCIAGGAAAMAPDALIIMEWDGTTYGSFRVMKKSALPETLPEGLEIKWDYLWVKEGKDLEDTLGDGWYDMTQNYGMESISDFGRDALGLTDNEAVLLFNGTNAIEHVVQYAKEFADERGVTLNLPDWITDGRYLQTV